MKNSFDEKILDEAKDWLEAKQIVILATVIQTWGSSPRPVGSKMIINNNGDFSGSVSGGCVESAVVRECLGILKENKPFKKIEFKVSNENAWDVGLACGGEISIFLEQINKIKKKLLTEIVEKKNKKIEFAIVTNLENSDSCIFDKKKILNRSFSKYEEEISTFFKNKKNGIIESTNIFVETFIRPIKVIIIGAVHIAQYLVNFMKDLNFELVIIDPRGYFASKKRFPEINTINAWPKEAFGKIKTNKDTALIALTHDPKIDDPALQHALINNFFYIGALGSKKTHSNRCLRLKESGFSIKEINRINGPIGIKLGGKSAPEIALSIIAQLISHIYKK